VTTVREEGKEGSATAVAPPPESTAPARACAREDTPPAAPASLLPVTRRVQAPRQILSHAAAALDRPGSLVHAQPPTLARAREQHHEAADRHSVPLFKGMRLAWGYFHLIFIKSVLNGLEWVTKTPLRLIGATILALVIWHWS
jgi:hypothetical protein